MIANIIIQLSYLSIKNQKSLYLQRVRSLYAKCYNNDVIKNNICYVVYISGILHEVCHSNVDLLLIVPRFLQ